MALPEKLRQRLEMALREQGGREASPHARLAADARRLWRRIQSLAGSEGSIGKDGMEHPEALELACWALQLPLVDDAGAVQLRRRVEEAADRLETLSDAAADASLLESAMGILLELTQRPVMSVDVQLLADALNLEDFGLIGLAGQILQHAQQDRGLETLIQGCDKREQYGYWDARLKEFHLEQARTLARRRLEHYRTVCGWLQEELTDS